MLLVFLLGRQLRHDPRRPHQSVGARRHGSLARTAISPTGWCPERWSRAWAAPWTWWPACATSSWSWSTSPATARRSSSRSCELPLTGAGVVDMLITDLAVFRRPDRKRGFDLIELAPGVTEARAARAYFGAIPQRAAAQRVSTSERRLHRRRAAHADRRLPGRSRAADRAAAGRSRGARARSRAAGIKRRAGRRGAARLRAAGRARPGAGAPGVARRGHARAACRPPPSTRSAARA